MKFKFLPLKPLTGVAPEDWFNPSWQMKNCLQSVEDFSAHFELSSGERQTFQEIDQLFRIRVTPYYASLVDRQDPMDPIRRILMPHDLEKLDGGQQMLDPLGEDRHRPVKRIIHRYPDRALFLVTDFCSVYCRYCTRKHFTAKDQVFPSTQDYEQALLYIRSNPAIREVILSGGDPLTLSDSRLEQVLTDLRNIDHVEIIRVGSRMPVVCPMRITPHLVKILRKASPVYFLAHFNHPRELTAEAAEALGLLVDNGIPVMNQMVLLNGVNNHPAIVQALSRRLLYLRVKPYYMFQCDPSEGTSHLQTSVDQSLEIQKELWGRLSGLALPNLSLDIPGGGGKVGLVPDFEVRRQGVTRTYQGWDGFQSEYVSPDLGEMLTPSDAHLYIAEWNTIVHATYGTPEKGRATNDSQSTNTRTQRQGDLER